MIVNLIFITCKQLISSSFDNFCISNFKGKHFPWKFKHWRGSLYRFFVIQDWTYLKAAIREFKVRRELDSYCELDTGIGDFEERDSGNSHWNEARTRMSFHENSWRNWSSRSMKSTKCTDSLAFKRRLGCSATLFSYCAGMKIISEASCQFTNFSMAHRVTWHQDYCVNRNA